jgi:hypothetical protein
MDCQGLHRQRYRNISRFIFIVVQENVLNVLVMYSNVRYVIKFSTFFISFVGVVLVLLTHFYRTVGFVVSFSMFFAREGV